MKVAHLSGEPEASVTFRDGLGVRMAALSEAGERLERFVLSDAFVPVQRAVQERVTRLQNLHHVRFARLRGFETARRGGQSVVISSETVGRRLSDVLLFGLHGLVTVDIGPALQVTREVLAALSVLHDSRNVTHGSIAPERIVLSPNGRVVMVEHVLSQALDRLQLPRQQLWRDWRIATPPAAGPVRFDTRTDLAQTGVTVLALLLGRSLEEEEYPHRLRGLLPVVRERLSAGGASRIARDLQQWLERLLPSDGGRPYASVKEAQLAFEALVSTPASSLGMAPARVKALLTACAALEDAPAESAAPQPVDGEQTVAPPDVTSEVFSVVPVAAPADSVPVADVEDVDIEALLRLAAELDAESDGRVAPLAAQEPAALEPPEATIPPEPAALAVGLDALASERVSLHQQFADLLAQVAPAAEETASPEPAASSLVLDAIRWTFEPVADGGSTPLVPWRDATADEHARIAQIGSTETSPSPVTTDVDAWLLTSLAPGDGGTDAATAHADDATDVSDSAPAIVAEVVALPVSASADTIDAIDAINTSDSAPVVLLEVDDAAVFTETVVADGMASNEPLLTLADAIAAIDTVDGMDPAPVVLVEAGDAEVVAESVIGKAVPSDEPLLALADVVAAESPLDAAPLGEEVTAAADACDATPNVLVEAADVELVGETIVADVLATDEPPPAFVLSASADAIDSSDSETVVLLEVDDAAVFTETVVADGMASNEPLLTLADAIAAIDTVDGMELAPVVLVEAGDAEVVAESVIGKAVPSDEPLLALADVVAAESPLDAAPLGEEVSAAADACAATPIVLMEVADVEVVAETIVADVLATHEPPPAFVLTASADAIDSSDSETVVLVETADAAVVAESVSGAAETSDEPLPTLADAIAAIDTVDGMNPAPVVLVEAGDAQVVAETIVADVLATDEPPPAGADVFAAEPITIADTSLEVAAFAVRGSADALDTLDASATTGPAPVVPIEAAAVEEVAETFLGEAEASDEPLPLFAAVVAAESPLDAAPLAEEVSAAGDTSDASSVAAVEAAEAAECELPPSAPVVEEAQAAEVLLPVAKPSKRRRSRRKTRKSVESVEIEDVPPSPPLSAGLSLVNRDVSAWQPPADLRSVVADAARRAAVGAAAPPVAPPVAPPMVAPVVFTPVETETTPPILQATLPAAVTVVADLIATQPDLGPEPEPEPRSRTIVVLRQQVNWRRTAAAAVIIALLETAAFGAAWWWVQPGAKGTLVVETSVPGVEVLIDGALVGHTPFHNEVRPGRHTLTLRRGGLERSMPIEINLGVVTTQTLPWPRPSTGALRVTSAPDGAEVLVGGRVRGRTPLTIDDLPAGRQTLLLRGPSGTVSAAATVVAGETAVVDVPIFAGWVQVDAAVELVVSIDGTRVGTSVDGQFLLSPGTHRIDVSNETLGFEQALSATVEPGRVRSLTVTLPEVPLLAPGADGAEVFVDGVSRGVLPDGSITVPLGTHEVVLRGTDGVERRRTLTVRAGAPVSFD